MVKVFLSKVIVMSILVCSMAFASCSSDVPTAPNEEETGNPQQPGDTEGSVSTVKFSLDFNSLSRANIPVDLDKYDVKVYVYQAVSTAKGIKLVVELWDEWSSFESSEYKLFVEDKYNGTPLNFELPELNIPRLSLGAEAERYQYKIVVIASTKDSRTLPELGGDSNKKIDGQFTNPVGEGAESIEIFKDYFFIKNLESGDNRPDENDKLDFSELKEQGKYDEKRKALKAVLTRKSGEVQVTVMKNAKDNIITNLLQAKTIDVTISYAASAIGFEPITPLKDDDKTGLSYDVNLKGTATIKKSFPVDFNNNNAEVLLLESLPRYRYKEGLDEFYQGIELKLEFKNEGGDIIKSISVAQEKKFYIFPNTRSTITLGKSGFEFGDKINLDDDSWDGIH